LERGGEKGLSLPSGKKRGGVSPLLEKIGLEKGKIGPYAHLSKKKKAAQNVVVCYETKKGGREENKENGYLTFFRGEEDPEGKQARGGGEGKVEKKGRKEKSPTAVPFSYSGKKGARYLRSCRV